MRMLELGVVVVAVGRCGQVQGFDVKQVDSPHFIRHILQLPTPEHPMEHPGWIGFP